MACCDCECGERYRSFWSDGWNFRDASSRQMYIGLIEVAHALTESKNDKQLDEWKRHIYQQWRMNIVPTYTQLHLTKESDRLPALSAVVQGLENVLNDTYMCGLWRADLENGLTWSSGAYGTNPPIPGKPPSQYRAPSWSWASVEGPVDVCYDYEDDYEPIISVLDAKVTPAGKDPRSDVRIGSVNLSGHLLPGNMAIINQTDREQTINIRIEGSPNPIGAFWPDTLLARKGKTIQRCGSEQVDRTISTTAGIYCLASLMARKRTNMGFRGGDDDARRPTIDFEAERWLTFIVLSPIKEHDGAQFERLGIIKRFDSKLMTEKWYERWPKSVAELI